MIVTQTIYNSLTIQIHYPIYNWPGKEHDNNRTLTILHSTYTEQLERNFHGLIVQFTPDLYFKSSCI